MPTELPIACSLDASELRERLAWMGEIGGRALAAVKQDGKLAELRFTRRDGVREELERIAAAESRCCPFLTLGVREEPDAVLLTIEAPEGAEPVIRELVGAFHGHR